MSLDRIDYWQERGAKLSDTVAGLVKRAPRRRPKPPRRDARPSRAAPADAAQRGRTAAASPGDIVVMGAIAAPYGVEGWFKVQPLIGRSPERCSTTRRGGCAARDASDVAASTR